MIVKAFTRQNKPHDARFNIFYVDFLSDLIQITLKLSIAIEVIW